MLSHFRGISLALCLLVLVCGCEAVATALLINELLDEGAPKREWSGVVRDSIGRAAEGLTVQVTAELPDTDDIMRYSDVTNQDGEYKVSYRWHEQVVYSLRVLDNASVIWEQYFGTVELDNFITDITISGTAGADISGVVTDQADDPLEDVLLVIATLNALDETPTLLLTTGGDAMYDSTNEAGIYGFDADIDKYVIVCAFHPDYGFAYAVDEDADNDGSVALNIQLADAGSYSVDVQVVDINDDPVAMQVLSAARQFRLRLEQPYNLSPAVDDVVDEAGLFSGMAGVPSDYHPVPVTIDVQATGLSGIAEGADNVQGGVYQLSLLSIASDEPATALIVGDNPLVLSEDSTVVVKVN